MSSKLTYIQGVIFLVLVILVSYVSLEVFAIPSDISAPHIQKIDSNWKGWANLDKIFSLCVCLPPRSPHSAVNPIAQYYKVLYTEFEIFSSGDSYTATGFEPTEQQPRPDDPFGNPTYNPISPYLKWIHYITVTYNDSMIETYNFAVNGATVDQELIDKGSAFSTQVREGFLPNYDRQRKHAAGNGDTGRGSRRRNSKSSSSNRGLLADWEPETTLFSMWFGINDNVFSNQSEALFDRVFESYNRSLHQVRVP